MSSSRKRTEHIERIRYPNPLPLPPYPPKLLHIPTPAARFADPRNVGLRLAQAHQLPVVVDAEGGMPLNLTDFPQAWYTDQELEADDDVFPRLDPDDVEVDVEDAFLLSDLLDKLPNGSANGVVRPEGTIGAIADTTNITWLRRTEYLAAEQQKRKKSELAGRGASDVIDASKEAQLARIKDTFAVANQPLSTVRHPTKPGLRAVDAFTLLPDPDTWATRYDVLRFGDLPGRMHDNKPLPDPRLETAILRPHVDLVGQPIYSLFLIDAPVDKSQSTDEKKVIDGDGSEDDMFGDNDNDEEDGEEQPRKKSKKTVEPLLKSREEILALEDEQSARLLRDRRQGSKTDAEVQDVVEAPFDVEESDEAPVHLAYTRDYEAHDESERKDQELIVTYIDRPTSTSGGADATADGNGILPPVSQFEHAFRHRRSDEQKAEANGQTSDAATNSTKVAYYHPVSLRASLRVRRRRANDPRPPEHWDAISLGKRSLSMYEKVERLYVRAGVDDMDAARLPERIEVPAEEITAEADEQEAADPTAARARDPSAGDGERAQGIASDETDRDDDKEAVRERKQRDRVIKDNDDDENEDAANEQQKSLRDKHDETDATNEGGDDEDKDDDDDDDDDDESGSDDGSAQTDEEMDEDELAALQADAGDDAVPDREADDGGTGARRRSRRAAAAVGDAQTRGDGEDGERKPREPLLMDIDEED